MFFCKCQAYFFMNSENIPLPLLEILYKHLGNRLDVVSFEPKGGGSINSAALIKTSEGNFFAKWNSVDGRKGMFKAEEEGLKLLASTHEIRVPKTIGSFEDDVNCYLVMEYLESGDFGYDFWEVFGSSLARMHKHTAEKFGLNKNNFIGSLPQNNTQHDSWTGFFIENRLQPQLKRAVDAGKADEQLVKKFENLYRKLDEIFPKEKPALVHGDLWGGNFMCTLDEEPAIYDPAVYYGNREMDLAMSRLFGGFDSTFYEAYHAEFPLEAGFEKRLDICNLYPLLVHVNLFPGSYVQSVKHIVSRF